MTSEHAYAALFAHELLKVVRPTRPCPGRRTPLPPAERVDARPRPRRRARPTVRVDGARLDPVEEPLNLRIVLREYTRRQSKFRFVRKLQCLFEALRSRML